MSTQRTGRPCWQALTPQTGPAEAASPKDNQSAQSNQRPRGVIVTGARVIPCQCLRR